MRVILEETDVIALLGKAMNRNLNATDVEIHVDPFEVVIHDATGILSRDREEPKENAELQEEKSSRPVEEEKSFEDLAKESAVLAARPPKKAKVTTKRQLMHGESFEPRNPLLGGDDGD
jgi:hypothetical protein